MTLESSIKDVIAKKLEDGTVEKMVEEQLQKGIINALDSLFGRCGVVTKVIEKQITSVMVPYLEKYDYGRYIVKLDGVLVDVLKEVSADNKTVLQNFKELMLPIDRDSIKASEIFEAWCKYVAKGVATQGLDVICEDSVSYESVEVTLAVSYDDEREWSPFQYATLTFECEHDNEMNFAIRLHHYNRDKENEWSMSYDYIKDIKSLRRVNDFEILLMRLDQAQTKIILDTDSECEDVTPDKEPEVTYG
ncbi:hypothetical protein EV210_101226 [Anaerospora hongkongensis]|uniref:Uncharacterized protein n=1 Tax=Anaerospora hongkongensis TaxID=244830 RepID=A0A4R1Q634_9FIRM|nr:hypothetical protein [Anaerospora hongkongensis]TCL40026.1 hypothetical protein EV210_101226 [Anaerospora hongkongensis]